MSVIELDSKVFYNLLRECIDGQTPNDVLVQKLGETLNSLSTNKEIFYDMIVDSLYQCDIETSLGDKDKRDVFLELVKSLLSASVLPTNIANERLDIDLNLQIGVISEKKVFTVNYNRTRTKLYFKQKKFNLLREENEGFARLLVQLAELKQDNVQDTLKTIVDVIGEYRLDPNRVLDLIIQVFQFRAKKLTEIVDFEPYLSIIRYFYKCQAKLTQLIILRLDFYTNVSKDRLVPEEKYRVLAVLIHKELMDLDDIYPYLLPDDGKILNYHQKLVEEARGISKKYAMAVVGDEKPFKSVIESLKEGSREDYHFLVTDNQKVNLCAHLIDLGDWEQALNLARKLPEYFCFSNQRVASAACKLINYLIEPIYRDYGLPKQLSARMRPLPTLREPCPQQVTTIDDFANRIFPMLIALGPFISTDIILLTKIIRILRQILVQQQQQKQDNDNISDQHKNNLTSTESPIYYQILDVINSSILPASSLTSSNCCLARELWTLIKNFKYHIRYKLYYEWREEGSNPHMLRHRGQILLRAKHHMKRLSKETLRPSGRNIGKLCYPNPVITLNYILAQVQSYDNLISLVVDALRFLPPIALDALIYCIIEALSDSGKNKKSLDGMALAQWLMSLSNFSANIILRYKVEFTSFLDYIANQLKIGNSLDLVLLTDLIQKMTGIETIQAITDERIEAMMGGDVLRTEGAYFNQVKNTRKSSARLKDALIESRLAMPLCILIAQLRDSLFFSQQDGAPLKLVGKLYDQCQETLVQYGVFLSMNLSIDDYINFLPPLEKLMTEHKLDPDAAFFLARPMIFHRIKSKFNQLKNEAAHKMLQQVVEEGEAPPELSSQILAEKFVEAAKSVIDPIAENIQPILAEKYVACDLNSKLFVIFWTLSMSDIEVPVNCYEREIARSKATVSELSKLADEDPKKRKEKERCTNLIHKLKQEQADQIEQANYIRLYLESERNNLFCENSSYDNVYLESRRFVQHCPFARCIQTAYDAIYSARFMLYLHELKVENYPTIICLDRLLCDLTYMMGACTENEANHYGRFLCNILKTSSHWHSSSEVYNEQCEKYPGSIINIDNSEYINYETYRDICYKWHYRLTRSFSVALESNNYIQIRNALIVMISIIDYYPAIKHFGKGIGIKIEDVRNQEKESRQDLYALATAYAGRLDERKPTLIPESNFHTVDVKSSGSQKEKHSSSSSRKKARHS